MAEKITFDVDKVSKARKEQNMTIQELSYASKVSISYTWQATRGSKPVSLHIAKRLAKALKRPVEELQG